MKLVNLFDDFLKDTVNLNQTRIDLLDDSIAVLKTFVRGVLVAFVAIEEAAALAMGWLVPAVAACA